MLRGLLHDSPDDRAVHDAVRENRFARLPTGVRCPRTPGGETRSVTPVRQAAVLLFAVSASAQVALGGTLYAVANGPDLLLRYDAAAGSFDPVGAYALNNPVAEFALGGLEFAPDGILYGVSITSSARLYTVDAATAQLVEIGPLNVNAFEGGLAFDPLNGTLYGVNAVVASAASLYTVDLLTGQASVVGAIGGGNHDFNGLVFDGDGNLFGIDRVTNALWRIDKTNPDGPMTQQVGAGLGPIALGGFGGMAVDTDAEQIVAYAESSKTLFAVDLTSGSASVIQNLGPGAPDITGLAFIPEPATAALLLTALLARRRGRRRRPTG